MATRIMKIDGADVPIVGCASMSESALMVLRGFVPVRVGALFNYDGQEHRVTACDRWQDYHKTFDGYRIVAVSVAEEEWFNNHSMLGPKKWKRQEVPVPGASDGGRSGTPTHQNDRNIHNSDVDVKK